MFGKVLASCVAGLLQLVVIFGAAKKRVLEVNQNGYVFACTGCP